MAISCQLQPAARKPTTAARSNTTCGLPTAKPDPFFRDAVEIDPNLVVGYSALGLLYSSLGETTLGSENTRKAYLSRDRVSASERLIIEFQYDFAATGQIERAIETGRLWSRDYPRDWTVADDSR